MAALLEKYQTVPLDARADGGVVESASDLVFAGFDLGGNGQDSGADSWIGASERSADALGAYREAFQTVLGDWQVP
jgi:hypothetical protein